MLQALLKRSKDRVLERCAIKKVADEFENERYMLGILWSRALSSSPSKLAPMDVSSRKYRSGRKNKNLSLQLQEFPFIPLRKALRDLVLLQVDFWWQPCFNRTKAGTKIIHLMPSIWIHFIFCHFWCFFLSNGTIISGQHVNCFGTTISK